jgi:hypothetical protein
VSGPKSGSYQVVSAAELRRRSIAAAQDRHARALAEAQAFHGVLAAAVAAYGSLAVRVPATTAGRAREAADWDQATSALTAGLADARRQLEEQVRTARAHGLAMEGSQVKAVLRDQGTRDRRTAAAAAREKAASEPAASEPAASEPAASEPADEAKLAEVLRRLPADAGPEVAGQCERLARSYLSSPSPAERSRVLDSLRFQVQAARDRQARITRNSAAVEALYRELDGLRGEQVDTVRGALKGLDRSADLPGDLRERVAAAKAAAEAERDREFVLTAAAKALSELGYTIGDDFRTAVPSAGAVLEIPNRQRHGVQVRERDKRLQLNVVRFDAAGERDRIADRDAEEAFCRDFDQVKEKLRQEGVDLTMLRADSPGQTPVQVMADERRPRPTSRRAGRPASQLRGRGHSS